MSVTPVCAALSVRHVRDCRAVVCGGAHPSASSAAPSPVTSLHPPSLVALFDRVSDRLNGVGEECNELIEEEQQLRGWKEEQKGRQWTEAAVLEAAQAQPGLLSRGEQQLRHRLSALTTDPCTTTTVVH